MEYINTANRNRKKSDWQDVEQGETPVSRKVSKRFKKLKITGTGSKTDSMLEEPKDDLTRILNGDFREDFSFMCRMHGLQFIPDIVLRPKIASPERAQSPTKPEQARLSPRSKRASPGIKTRGSKPQKDEKGSASPSTSTQSLNLSMPTQRRLSNLHKKRKSTENLYQARKGSLIGLHKRSSFLDGPPMDAVQEDSPLPTLTDPVVEVPSSQVQTRSSMSGEIDVSRKKSNILSSQKDGQTATSPDGQEQTPSLSKEIPQEEVYTTFLTTLDTVSYFKPCIQVEQEVRDDGVPMIKEVYIRGWKVDELMVDVLTQCWACLPYLATIHMWNVALDYNTLTLLAEGLLSCLSLRTLCLDGNRLEGCNVSRLLWPGSPLQHLSLRFCCLTDVEAYGLAGGLKNPAPTLSCLLSLCLSNNAISDVGVGYIADALRTNRSLLVLNLASNKVKDEGAVQLAAVLKEFPLTHEEELQRRQLLSIKMEKENVRPQVTASVRRVYSQLKTSPSRHRNSSGENSAKSVKDERRQKLKTPAGRDRKFSPMKKVSASQVVLDLHAKQKTEGMDDKKRRVSSKSRGWRQLKLLGSKVQNDIETICSTELSINPLTVHGELRDGKVWVTGNHTLLSLNLSRNAVGRVGVMALLEMVKAQILGTQDKCPGLRRLLLHRNALPDTDEAMRALCFIMNNRDPSWKMSDNARPAENVNGPLS